MLLSIDSSAAGEWNLSVGTGKMKLFRKYKEREWKVV